jgi:hypothetical protein
LDDTFSSGDGSRWRLLGKEPELAPELEEQGFNAVWIVEPA